MKFKNSILMRVLLIYLVVTILILGLSYYVTYLIVNSIFVNQNWALFLGTNEVMTDTLTEYNSYKWVLRYLMDYEGENHDHDLENNEESMRKEIDFLDSHGWPSLQLITEEEAETLSAEDQRLFVELIYHHWISRLDDLSVKCEYSSLSIAAVDDDAKETLYLLDTSIDNLKKKDEAVGEAYDTIEGISVPNNEKETAAIKKVLRKKEINYCSTDDELKFYSLMDRVDDKNIICVGTLAFVDVIQWLTSSINWLLAIFFGLQMISTIICLIALYIIILRPIQKMRGIVTDYTGSKETDQAVEALARIKTGDEIGELASDISEMMVEIDSYVDEIRSITAEKERINAELSLAKKVQAAMLPSTFPAFPDRSEFDIYAAMNPAREVGGDFYDFFMADENHIALVIADVSGKGMPAALFMVISKILIKIRIMIENMAETSLSKILADVNTWLIENNKSQMFVTVWAAIVDLRTGKGIASNAGHEHPAVRKEGEEFELIRYRHSPMLGIIKKMEVEEHEFQLNPGDRLFVYTDGVPEATNGEGKLFGTERMTESLNRHKDLVNKELLEQVKKDIDTFVDGAEQFDDITMLVFDYKG